jgi:hypothetical protein
MEIILALILAVLVIANFERVYLVLRALTVYGIAIGVVLGVIIGATHLGYVACKSAYEAIWPTKPVAFQGNRFLASNLPRCDKPYNKYFIDNCQR